MARREGKRQVTARRADEPDRRRRRRDRDDDYDDDYDDYEGEKGGGRTKLFVLGIILLNVAFLVGGALYFVTAEDCPSGGVVNPDGSVTPTPGAQCTDTRPYALYAGGTWFIGGFVGFFLVARGVHWRKPDDDYDDEYDDDYDERDDREPRRRAGRRRGGRSERASTRRKD